MFTAIKNFFKKGEEELDENRDELVTELNDAEKKKAARYVQDNIEMVVGIVDVLLTEISKESKNDDDNLLKYARINKISEQLLMSALQFYIMTSEDIELSDDKKVKYAELIKEVRDSNLFEWIKFTEEETNEIFEEFLTKYRFHIRGEDRRGIDESLLLPSWSEVVGSDVKKLKNFALNHNHDSEPMSDEIKKMYG